MEALYLGEDWREATIDDKFAFPGERRFAEVAALVRSGKSWSGRAAPHRNKHGIASVDLMLQEDPQNADRVWMYILEHPVVDGEVRFSSRSELHLLQVLLDNTLEYVFFRDTEGHFILTNKAFRDAIATGNSVVSATGQRIDAFISGESAEWVRRIDVQVYASGLPSVNNVSRFVFNNGTKHWLQMSTVPVRSSAGEIVGAVSVARDISDLKRTESELRTAITRAKDASRAKGEFLAAMSHEIRTPINGIIGASELCQETQLDSEQRGYVETVMQCSNTLLSLVNDVLDFSKIEAGQLNLEKLNFNPGALVEDVAEEFVQAARKKGIELIVVYDEELPRYMMGDPTRVKQILYNLTGNAVKFTGTGEIILKVETMGEDPRGPTIRFVVSDTGIGIEESRQRAIFASFTQADMSTTRQYGGTGLGLAICKELAELMRGTIRVESVVGRGSSFIVELPLQVPDYPGGDAIPYNPELAGLRVLIVDDNKTNRDIYQQMCLGWGYRSASASDGLEALSMLEAAVQQQDPFRLVFLDQQMPGLTGLDLASLVVNRPELNKTQLLLLSSSLNREEIERAEGLGIARALSKPVKRATLIEVILETFNIHGPERTEEFGMDVSFSVDSDSAIGESMKVLLAEDNLVNQKIARRRLEKMGHAVTVVPNGREALRAVEADHYDCILMDVQMPEMDGYAATQAIRQLEQAKGLPAHFIVAMTAHAMKGDEEKCRSVGMDQYIAKPFRVERLREVLRMVEKRPPPVDVSHVSSFAARLLSMGDEARDDLLAAGEILSESLPSDIEKLQGAIEEREFKKIAFMAHTIKGVAGLFDDGAIVAVGDRLGAACENRDTDAIERISAEFIDELLKLLEAVRSALDDQSMALT